jgi:hypothetical protein
MSKRVITLYFDLGDKVKILSENVYGTIENIGFNHTNYLTKGINGLGDIEYIVVDANNKNYFITDPLNLVELNSQEIKQLEADIKQYQQDYYDDDEEL